MKTEKNIRGLTRADYAGSKSTLCLGCGHDSVTNHIITAFHQSGIDPERVTKLSGIGCSGKTPAYFMSHAFGFNSIHGRMAPVATGVHLANREQMLVGVSGDGDTASIGLGGFAHMLRRNVPMLYIVENNGVYGLTKGQFSATAEEFSLGKSGTKNSFAGIDLCTLALDLGCTFVARSFSGDAKQLVPLLNSALRHRGTAFIDIISPCVTFANHPGSSRSFESVRTRNVSLHDLEFTHVDADKGVEIELAEGESQTLDMHDGSQLALRKLENYDHDVSRRDLAYQRLSEARERHEFLTGLFYWDKSVPGLAEKMNLVDRPLAQCGEETRPTSKVLDHLMSAFE